MKTSTIAIIVVGIVALLGLAGFGYYPQFYNREFTALKEEIGKHPKLQIVDQRRHEDVTLEDFGFRVKSPGGTLWLEIADGSQIRLPRHRAVGIAFDARDPMFQVGNSRYPVRRLIHFDSSDWAKRGLPKVNTLADVLAHFDSIAASLLKEPPVDMRWDYDSEYVLLGR